MGSLSKINRESIDERERYSSCTTPHFVSLQINVFRVQIQWDGGGSTQRSQTSQNVTFLVPTFPTALCLSPVLIHHGTSLAHQHPRQDLLGAPFYLLPTMLRREAYLMRTLLWARGPRRATLVKARRRCLLLQTVIPQIIPNFSLSRILQDQ